MIKRQSLKRTVLQGKERGTMIMLKPHVLNESLQAAYLFNTGQSYRADKFLGVTRNGQELTFRVWAPHAEEIHLVSAHCDWAIHDDFAIHDTVFFH